MNTEKIKEHFRRNKVRYIVVGEAVVVIVVGVAAYIVGKKVGVKVGEARTSAINISGINLGPINSDLRGATVTSTLQMTVDPGWVIEDLDTGLLYRSQNECAKALGLSPSNLSKFLTGKQVSIGGHNLVRRCKNIPNA